MIIQNALVGGSLKRQQQWNKDVKKKAIKNKNGVHNAVA